MSLIHLKSLASFGEHNNEYVETDFLNNFKFKYSVLKVLQNFLQSLVILMTTLKISSRKL